MWTALYKDQKIPKESRPLILSNKSFLLFSIPAKTKTYLEILKKKRIQSILYMDYFKTDTFLKITSIQIDNNLNKESIATFILNTNYKFECLCPGTVMGHSPKIQEQLLKHFLDAICLLQVHKTLTSLKRFCFCNSTVLQCHTNLLQTRSKNAAFIPVFIFPAPTLKESAEHYKYQKATYNNNNKKPLLKLGLKFCLQ